MASEQEDTREVPVEQRVISEPEDTRGVPADQGVASEQKEEAAAGSRKPSVMEQVKGRVADVKDKLTGHSHHASPTKHAESETHAAKAQSPKGEGFLQKIKEKLPGTHAHEHKTAATTPGHTATYTTEPAAMHTGEPVHKEGIGEKVRHIFKGGHSDAKTGEHTRAGPPSKEVEGVAERDILKE